MHRSIELRVWLPVVKESFKANREIINPRQGAWGALRAPNAIEIDR